MSSYAQMTHSYSCSCYFREGEVRWFNPRQGNATHRPPGMEGWHARRVFWLGWWLEGERAAAFLVEGWAKQPSAPSAPAGQKVAGVSHLRSLTFCMSLWAEARLREETTSGPDCLVSANSRMGSRCTLFAFRKTWCIAVCPSPGETSPPACLLGHATFPCPISPSPSTTF